MVDLDIRTSFKEVMQCIIENAYSRIPIYSGSRDNIKGVLYIKDLLPHVNKGDNFRWQSLIRPAYFVPETKMIDDLLGDFQANKIHIAIVVDEFGGTSGLVTMEDIIEEIVGEIHDEYDDEERTYVVLNDHTWIFEAKTQLTDFYKIAKVDEDEFEKVVGDADTLAGMLLEIKGEFPALHEKVTYHNYEFESMGDEQLEESEFEPMFDGCKAKLQGKKIALFGSYGWGDGEWMRTWEEDCISTGAQLACKSVICNEAPDAQAEADCVSLGKALA